MRDFVCRPPPANTRLYCTMIRRDVEESVAGVGSSSDLDAPYTPGYGVAFTLYLEFLGGLIPLLKVKTTLPSLFLISTNKFNSVHELSAVIINPTSMLEVRC